MSSLGFQYTIQKPWTVAVTGLLCVEEVVFTIQLKQDTDNVVADFHLQQGCERNFLRLFEIVRNHARSLDAQPMYDRVLSPVGLVQSAVLMHFPHLSHVCPLCSPAAFASSADWLNVDSMPELFPGSSLLTADMLLEYCEDYLQLAEDSATSTSSRGDAARLEMAACIKNACLADKNRELVIKSPDLAVAFGSALYRMVQDDVGSIVRFAVFILSLFDVASLVSLAGHVHVMLDSEMLSILDKMETHDPIPKMKSIAASVRTKLVPSN
ncbi:hypothetical protein DYB32_006869 [Aphanomyces invadans]|uniref:Uncharacterized protein n=1 Tax=Aphanomyces invadans TaxID=157072 RepID=A0A3R6V7W2_9STRA|nr:hypothetical protein DYB32_006869 [Aphanomyces invadans]